MQSTEVFKHFFKNNELYLCKNLWFMEEQVKRNKKVYILSNYDNILSFC